MSDSKYILNEIGKGLQMGLDSISNILFEEFGMNKNNLIYSTRYYSSKNLIGDCYDSSICVIGGVDNG